MELIEKVLMVTIVVLLVSIAFFVLNGCTTFDPKNDKNVSYTFETISYESPNSTENSDIGGVKQALKIPKI